MSNVTITQLPAAEPLTGSESVPIVQNGVTVRTTTAAIAASPSQQQTFLTLNQEPTLPNSRYLSASQGIGLVDGGPLGSLNIELNGASESLETAGNGFIVKTSGTTVTPRVFAVSGAGLNLTNGNGQAGNPTLQLTGQVANFANAAANGLVTLTSGGAVSATYIQGTAGRITVTNGNGIAGAPTVDLAATPVTPGTYGSSSQTPVITVDSYGRVTNISNAFIPAGGTVTQIDTGTGLTGGPITTSGTINIDTGVVATLSGSQTLTNKTISGSDNSLSNIANTSLVNYSVTYNGITVALGGSGTIVAANPFALTIGTGLSGVSYDGSTAVTIAIDSTVATIAGAQTLTNKTISGASNTLSNIGNSSLTNSSVTYNGVTVALGSSGTITATTTAALTAGTGLQLNSGTTFDGSTAKTISIDSTVVTLTGAQTLTNKTLTTPVIAQIVNSGTLTLPTSTDTLVGRATTDTLTNKSISGSSNTLTNIPNSALTNSSITLGTTNIALGATSLAPAGLTSVTVTQDPTSALQLATKQYVDNLASTGLYYHAPVQVATTQTLAAQTGGTVTYNNGTGGVGATLTLSVALTTLDGYSLVNGDRILVKNEANQANNGVYTWATGGTVLTRATDADSYGPGPGDLSENDYFFVQNGTVNKGNSYICSTVGTITFGTTAITFAQFSTSQVYSAGTGLSLTNTTFSISNTGVTANTYGSASAVPVFAVNAQGQITSVTNTNIAIAASQVTSGTLAVAQGGTNIASYTIGDMLYASGATTLSKLTLGTQGYVLKAGASGPEWGIVSGGTF